VPGPPGRAYTYGVYFEAAGGSFGFTVSTEPKVEPYTGPGTYHAHATLDRLGQLGPAQHYQGDVVFVVTLDPLTGRVPGGAKSPNTGTVDGSLRDPQGRMVSVSGGWTCVPSMLTGPG
jgi:hypothetical protein